MSDSGSDSRGIFITGASTGLGNAAARLFAARGWRVVATMRRPGDAGELAAVPGVELLALDVTRPEQIAEATRQATAAGRIDVVFNNAGYGVFGPLEGASDEQITNELNTNLLGVVRTTQAFTPYFRERGHGLFINTSSIGALVTFPFFALYHASKWALEGFSESVAFELAPLGIGVKTVVAGFIKSDFSGRSLVVTQHPAYGELLGKMAAAFQQAESATDGSTPEQIAEVVYEAATDGKSQLRYLAGPDAVAFEEQRRAEGVEGFRASMTRRFFGA